MRARWKTDVLTLEISDRGPGTPPAARERIFTPFERVLESTNEGASGNGTGLAIGRDLAGRTGGMLELLDSESGAAFRLRIPAPPMIAISPKPTPHESHPKRIPDCDALEFLFVAEIFR